MKIGLALITILLVGLGLLGYSYNSLEILNWDKIDSKLVEMDRELYGRSDVWGVLRLEYSYGNLVEFLNLQSLFAAGFGLFLTAFSVVTISHLLVDKFLFRKYYDEPNYKLAMFRGGLVGGFLISILLITLYDLLNIVNFITVLLIFNGIDMFSKDFLIRDKIEQNKIN